MGTRSNTANGGRWPNGSWQSMKRWLESEPFDSRARAPATSTRQELAKKITFLIVSSPGPWSFEHSHCLNWVLVRRRSDRLTAAIALIISRRPITDDLSIGSPIKIAELTSPIAGTESKLNDVVIAGKLRATVTNAQNGNAVINGPL